MEMLPIAIATVAIVFTLWVTSFFAKLMHAKNASIPAIGATWLIGAVLSFGFVMALDFVVLEDIMHLAAIIGGPLIIFTIAYKLINKMNWAAALTTNVMAIALGAIASVVAIVSMGKPLDHTIMMASSSLGFTKPVVEQTVVAEEEDLEDMIFTEKDLLSPETQAAMAAEEKRIAQNYREPKFTVMSVRSASGVVGYRVRVSKNSGKVVEGSLTKVRGGELVIQQRLHGGLATTPISTSSIKKMEVYR